MNTSTNPRARDEHGRARFRYAALTSAAVFALVAALGSMTAYASHPDVSLDGSNFEIDSDANLKKDDAAPIDWKNVNQQGGSDLATGQNDNSFGQGTKEDTAVPSVVSGGIPNNKSDLLNFGFYLESVSPAQQFLHLYWQRVQEPSGTTNMDFEFNKNKVSGTGAVLSSNGVTPVRSAGDLLLQYDLSQGGTNPTLWLSMWVTTGSSSQCEASNSVPCWGTKTNLTASNIATGSINTSPILAADSDGLGAMSARTFGEASVDWDAIAGGTGCTSFGSAYLKSRSSDTFTSALKDFIAPVETGFDACGSVRWLKKDNTGALLAGATFQVCQTHSYNPGTLSYTDITDVCVNSILDDSAPDTDPTAGEFQLDGKPLGRYVITETAAPTGYDIVTGPQTVNVTSASVFSAAFDFVNNPRMKIIVLTCNTVTEKLVDSTVDIDDKKAATVDDRKATLTGSAFDSLCSTGGAVYDNLPWDTYSGTVEVPDQAPAFPVVP